MSNLGPSIIRTFMAPLVALGVVQLARLGVKIDDPTVLELTRGSVAVVYYVGVRVLEQLHSSKWGWLLGSAKQPAYYNAKDAAK